MREIANDQARSPLRRLAPWKLEDAKARLSEPVRRARAEGPQRVTVHGRDAVVVVSCDEYEALMARLERPSLFALFQSSPLRDVPLEPAALEAPVREVKL